MPEEDATAGVVVCAEAGTDTAAAIVKAYPAAAGYTEEVARFVAASAAGSAAAKAQEASRAAQNTASLGAAYETYRAEVEAALAGTAPAPPPPRPSRLWVGVGPAADTGCATRLRGVLRCYGSALPLCVRLVELDGGAPLDEVVRWVHACAAEAAPVRVDLLRLRTGGGSGGGDPAALELTCDSRAALAPLAQRLAQASEGMASACERFELGVEGRVSAAPEGEAEAVEASSASAGVDRAHMARAIAALFDRKRLTSVPTSFVAAQLCVWEVFADGTQEWNLASVCDMQRAPEPSPPRHA